MEIGGRADHGGETGEEGDVVMGDRGQGGTKEGPEKERREKQFGSLLEGLRGLE